MKKYLTMIAVIILSIAFIAGMATAATEVEKQTAIDNALAFLAGTQNADGSIGSMGGYALASTAAAVLAFAEQGSTISGGTYQTEVQNAMNYIFSRAVSQSISMEPAGNPDTNGNGIGVYFERYPRRTYEVGLVLPAIVKAGSQSSVVATGSQVGRTYADVVQDAVDWIAWAQVDPNYGNYRGGWRYNGDDTSADNSVSQWPVIGMLYAQDWGINAPGFVGTELELWANYIQNANGGSGYTSPFSGVDPGKTGGLLVEHSYMGTALGDARVQNALSYLNTNWNTYGADGNFADAYMMWSIYKGLELYIGIDDESTITPRPQGTAVIDNPDHGWNWWEDYCEWLVANQLTSGAWSTVGPYADIYLGTAWYVNILAAT